MNAVAGDQVIARRTFLKGSFGALITPLAAEAQQAGKNVRIGVLSQGFPDPPPGLPLLPPLRVLGWVQGQNVAFPSRFDEGRPDRLPALAAELIATNVDLIFARGTPAARAAKAATATTPIVMIFVANPVRSGLVVSLAHPGGNITGTANLAADIFGKQLQLLKEIVPSAYTIGVLFDPLNPAQMAQLQNELASAAGMLAVKLHPLKVDASSDLEAVFAEAVHSRADALIVYPLSIGASVGRTIAGLAIKHRLATVATIHRRRHAGLLQRECGRTISSSSASHRQDPQGRQASRPADRTTDEVRSCHQPEDRQGARPRDPTCAAAASGSGDRVDAPSALPAEIFGRGARGAARARRATGAPDRVHLGNLAGPHAPEGSRGRDARFWMGAGYQISWWAEQGSNLRPQPCKGRALPAELSARVI